MRGAYYNENDDYCCAWLENLMRAGHIAPGYIDNRSIADVRSEDLDGYTQCHFFAGIGVWSYALRTAGWPDDRPVWTGSCPCQPFSGAGAGRGVDDERHLWPVWFDLIRERRPGVILGEQVASKGGLGWWDIVSPDLESQDYASGAIDTCVPGVGGPHIRQRLYWMAYRADVRRERWRSGGAGYGRNAARLESERLCDAERLEIIGQQQARGQRTAAERSGTAVGLGHPEGQPRRLPDGPGRLADTQPVGTSEADGMVNTCSSRPLRTSGSASLSEGNRQDIRIQQRTDVTGRSSPLNGFWANADWLGCIDAKWRPVEPGTQQMADGIARGVGLLCATPDKQEIVRKIYASGFGEEILRTMRGGNDSQKVWWSLGRCFGIPQATILLAVMCEQSRELGNIFNSPTQGISEIQQRDLRTLRQTKEKDARSPSRWELSQQCTVQLRNALSELSQNSSSFRKLITELADFTGSPLSSGNLSRMGRLRAYGNAIVAPQAIQFIEVVMEVLP